jgi:hypothetical protein
MYFCSRADNQFKTCYPSNARICEDLSLSPSSLKRAKNELYRAGFLKREFQFRSNNSQRSNLYTVAVHAQQFASYMAEMAATKICENLLMLYYIRRALKKKMEQLEQCIAERLPATPRMQDSADSGIFYGRSEPRMVHIGPPITIP